MNNDERINAAIEVAEQYAGIDGGLYNQWVIDQMLRVLLGNAYDEWVEQWLESEDGPKEWDEGITP